MIIYNHLCSSAASQERAGNGSEPAKPLLQIPFPPPWMPWEGIFTLSRGKRNLWKAMLCCSLSFPYFPLSCRIFALEQRFLLSSGAAMKSCPHIYDISGCYGGSVGEKNLLLLLFKGNYSACPRSKAPESWDAPLRSRETQTEPKNSNIWISWVTARLSCAHFPVYIIQGLFLKLQGANSGDERHLPRSFP